MDPNVQVALISVLATFITTLGVIFVAVINNRKERTKAANAGVEAALDERDVLEKMLGLIDENNRKEETIRGLRRQLREVRAERDDLRDQLQVHSKGDST